ncbi:PhzF family phenazine biosynthesis protein [Halohasta salina]|uniref:PhzF family phenazine biosynthesis protein n=1 Tax=Halohasta salina TaxID=2961621 RepID=UPI0020A469F3|nr:PhzF family phenazine biosynthesis protein [Halohasta salina]
MQSRSMALVDAFTTDPLSGNAAGVIPDADGLSDAQCQAVARELAVSETAFVSSSTEADRQIRYFTPTQAVDLCGHATIAAHAFLHDEGQLNAGSHSLETAVGTLQIEIEADGTVWMTQDSPTVVQQTIDYERLAEALGCEISTLQDVGADIPVARASTGLPVLVVPINFLESLGGLQPDFGAIEALSDDYDVAGIYAFTFDTLSTDSTAHGRFFAPAVGVDEDPVTGTASGACAAYFHAAGSAAFDDPPTDLTFEQGDFLDRAGRVRAQIEDDGSTRVRVGGQAVTTVEGTITIPDDETDDIIEA